MVDPLPVPKHAKYNFDNFDQHYFQLEPASSVHLKQQIRALNPYHLEIFASMRIVHVLVHVLLMLAAFL